MSKKRQILVTNDDGITADGLIRLVSAAVEFGDVWVVAPDRQRSANSHYINIHEPLDLYPRDFPVEGVRAFSCSGSPADCVRVGSVYLMQKKPEVVLAGINNGYNVASDIQYSGTAGAAFEAAFQGSLAIAFSEDRLSGCHEVSDEWLRPLLSELLQKKPENGYIWNVNFPGCPLSELRGVLYDKPVSTGMFYTDHYVEVEKLEDEGIRLMVEGDYGEDAEPDTDFWAVLQNYISVSHVNNVGFPVA